MKYALHFAVAALAAAFACATPSPTEYRDGAPMRPAETRPVYTPAGAGLPEYWAEPQPEAKPRSPYKRYLPPSREPGIWAGGHQDPPGRSDPAPQIKVLDVEVPLPPEVETRADAWLAVHCAYIMDLGMRTNMAMQSELAHRPKDKKCMAAMAFYWCTVQLGQRARDDLEGWARDGSISAAGRRLKEMLGPVETAGFAAAARECGLPVPAWTRTLYPIFDQMQHGKAPSVKQ